MRRFRLIVFIVVGIMCFTTLTYADIPRVINYQGKFTDKDDNPLTGNYLVTFRFYDVNSEGIPLWEEGHILSIENGIFNALLGSIKALDVDFDKDLWLGIEVASDGEMAPRIKLASAAYAMNAETIDMLESSQLMRNDIDAVMSGSLTLKKDLILKGDLSGPSRVVLTDAQGREYYLWVDNGGSLRLKQGLPASNKDGAVIMTQGSGALSSPFIKHITVVLLFAVVVMLGFIFSSIKKK
ncbi:hypothetical protein ACFL0P_04410 [Candidatus Omnitrophota bacterium]